MSCNQNRDLANQVAACQQSRVGPVLGAHGPFNQHPRVHEGPWVFWGFYFLHNLQMKLYIKSSLCGSIACMCVNTMWAFIHLAYGLAPPLPVRGSGHRRYFSTSSGAHTLQFLSRVIKVFKCKYHWRRNKARPGRMTFTLPTKKRLIRVVMRINKPGLLCDLN